ncbi:hypothetical protein ABE488_12920 [Luteimonas sp. TWI662]|uniref:hypothetical protein n=1 Tax=Luteimonas sp. TWI662 TaxID=3136789 RepID=UPI0032087E8F
MKSKVIKSIFVSMILLGIAACSQESKEGSSVKLDPGISAKERNQRDWGGHVCGLSRERAEFCPTDFIRLASYPLAADGKEIWIIGYLAVDGGQVALFASEEDYLDMQYGRSIRVLGTREQLEGILSEFGYKKVRLRGRFRANSFDSIKNDRLGDLLSPVTGRVVSPRSGMEGIQDIRVDVRDQQR